MPCFYTTDVRGIAVSLLSTATYGQQNKLRKSSLGCIPSSGIKSMKIYLTRLLTVFARRRIRAWKYQEKLKLSNTAASTTDILNPRSPDDAEFYRLPLSFSHSALLTVHLLLRQRVKRISQNTQNNGSEWPPQSWVNAKCASANCCITYLGAQSRTLTNIFSLLYPTSCQKRNCRPS